MEAEVGEHKMGAWAEDTFGNDTILQRAVKEAMACVARSMRCESV